MDIQAFQFAKTVALQLSLYVVENLYIGQIQAMAEIVKYQDITFNHSIST